MNSRLPSSDSAISSPSVARAFPRKLEGRPAWFDFCREYRAAKLNTAQLKPALRALAYRSFFDGLLVIGALKNSVHKNSRRMYAVRRQLAEFHQFFHFRDHIIRGSRDHRIEVPGRLAIDEVAPAIAFPRLDESEIASQGALQEIFASIKFARFFSLRNHRADAGGRIKRRNACAPRAHPLRQRALRIKFHLQFALQIQLLKHFISADVAGDHFLDLARFQKQSESSFLCAAVVGGAGEILGTFAVYGGDQVLRDAAGSEPADQNRGAVKNICYRGVGICYAFIHRVVLLVAFFLSLLFSLSATKKTKRRDFGRSRGSEESLFSSKAKFRGILRSARNGVQNLPNPQPSKPQLY